MDNHRKHQTADYIRDFAETKRKFWQPQTDDDTRVYNALRGKGPLPGGTAEPKSQAGKTEVKLLRTGKLGVASKRNAAVLSSPPTMRVNAIDPSDIKSRQHADKLEVFFAADWWLSQVGEVYHGQVKDLGDYARGWSNKFPLPRLWAMPEYKDMATEYLRLTQERGEDEGDYEAIDKERSKLDKKMEAYLCEHYPIRWRKMAVRSTFVDWSDEIYLPEIVEIRSMTDAQIATEYGEKYAKDKKSTIEKDVYVYHNHCWTQTVIGKEESVIAREWEHDLGINPCSLMEINVIDDEPGRRWESPYYDYLDMLETEDGMYSDMKHSVRRNTLAGPMFNLNLRERGIEGGADAAAIAQKIEYSPGEPLFLTLEEKYGLAPAPLVTRDLMELMDRISSYTSETLLNPTEMGRLTSQQSAVGYSTGLQAAQSRLDPYAIAIEKGIRHLSKVTIRSVIRICAEFPDSMDSIKLTAPEGKRGGKYAGKTVVIKPSDVENQENQIQPRLSISLPVNRNAEMALATSALNLPVPPDWILETFQNVENAEELLDRWFDWQIRTALLQKLVQMTEENAGEVAAGVDEGSLAELAQLIADLPPEAQFAIAQSTAQMAQPQQPTGGVPMQPQGQINGQTNANINGSGVLQGALSETEAQQIV